MNRHLAPDRHDFEDANLRNCRLTCDPRLEFAPVEHKLPGPDLFRGFLD